MPASPLPIDVVCGVIEDGTNRILAARRPIEKHMGGKWEFPGGKVEPGEEKWEALARELEEELAVIVEILAPLPPVVHVYPDQSIHLHPFRCRVTKGKLVAKEHEQIRWVTIDDITDLDWAPADLPIVAAWVADQKA